jgi:hypothetical protein
MPARYVSLIPSRSLRRWLLLGCLVGLLLAVVLDLVYSLLGPNFRVVEPGLVYRCAQLSSRELERTVKTYGIKTVINLRGVCEPAPWYLDQCRVLSRLQVSLEDLGCSAGRLPSTQTIRQLLEILNQTEYPILVHCHRGIDRTGLVVAVALLLHHDMDLDTALKQLGPRYAHVPWGRTGNLDRFFDLYREWLSATGQHHGQAVFRHWIESEYCPGECRAVLEILDPVGPELKVPASKPNTIRLRCTNASVKPWCFKPGSNAGIHAQYMLHTDQGLVAGSGQAGLFNALVSPGESIELMLALPALAPGRYILRADLIDEQHASFFQTGSEPVIREVVVQ